jgi:hypothetical protein
MDDLKEGGRRKSSRKSGLNWIGYWIDVYVYCPSPGEERNEVGVGGNKPKGDKN